MGQPRRVAVLGAAGFIGAHLVERLKADGYRVRPIDKAISEKHDLRLPVYARAAVSECDWVFHLAADMGGVGYFHSDADFRASTDNATISLNVLRACREADVERMFFASSACAYPTEVQQAVGSPLLLGEECLGYGTPDALYGAEKLWTLRACEQAPFDARVGVLHTVYGPGQPGTGPRAKFPPSVCYKAIQAAETGDPLVLWGTGKQMRSYLYVDDAVDRIVALMEADVYDGPVNVGYQGAITCLDAAQMACNALRIDPEIVCDPKAGPSGVQARDCDNAKWRYLYGETSDVPPSEGFARLTHWMLANRSALVA